MKQYCRYCSWACAQADDWAYCEAIHNGVSRNSRRDKCKHFSFNEIDAFPGFRGLDFDDPRAKYKPRKAIYDGTQERMF